MCRHHIFALILLLLVLTTSFASGIYDRLVVVGDVHGDYDQFAAVLVMSELIHNETHHWIGGNATLVQMGDLVDRGPHDKKVLDFVVELQKQAADVGGKVIALLGNHEIMNLQNHLHYVHTDSYEDFGGRHGRKREFEKDGLYGAFVRSMPVAYVAFNSLFVHAGLHPDFIPENGTLSAEAAVAELNRQVQMVIQENEMDERDPLISTTGPIWTRLLVKEAEAGRCWNVKRTLQLLGLDRMIVGHTPQRSGSPGLFCDDQLVLVDIGLSKWMYSNLGAVELQKDHNTQVVSLHEISAASFKAEDDATIEPDQGSDMNEALRKDPNLLQEMLETVREMVGMWTDSKEDNKPPAKTNDL